MTPAEIARRLSEAEHAATDVAARGRGLTEVEVGCDHCSCNGEIIVDWDLYMNGDDDDAATADCPECDGKGYTIEILAALKEQADG